MFNRAINGIKYWGQVFLLPVYWLSFLFPRSKKIWLFGSTFGRRFADNPRYLYLYCSQHREEISDKNDGKDIRPIWISHNREIVSFLKSNGYEAYYHHSIRGIWYCLRAKVYLFDNYSKDISFWLSGGAVKINLWHGIPLKKIQADNLFDKVRHPKNRWERFKSFPRRLSDEKPSHYVLTTSEYMRPVFESAFRTCNIFVIGYPRVDGFYRENVNNLYTENEQASLEQIDKLLNGGNRMVYYMPTFRDSEIDFFEVIDLNSFENFLKENKIIFCTKPHPKSKLKNVFESIESENIINIDAEADPYVFVSRSMALVTDYSSIYFDYLFTNKPIVFFNYDFEKYLNDSRELYFDYEEYTPGVKVNSQEALQKALLDVCIGEDKYVAKRDALKNRMFDSWGSDACAGLCEKIIQIL